MNTLQPAYDLSPLLQVMLMGALVASGPLLWWWLRHRGSHPQGRLQALTLVTLLLTFDLVLFGAFTRLTDSGLGCPDWPGCYGHASPLGAQAPIGDEGSYLMLRVGAASLFRSVGGPMLLAMLLLSGLALLGAAWSYWRQLPRLRKLYLSHAQSQATLHHLPLATLVLDAQQRVIRVNPAA